MKIFNVKNYDRFLSAAQMVGQLDAMEHALAYIENSEPGCSNRYMAIFDIAKYSGLKRFFTFDGETGSVFSEEAAHGAGSEGFKNDGYATEFSNNDGSHMSAIGMYKTLNTYEGQHGRSLRLKGLESTNDNSEARAIVMHGADYVKSGKEAGDSWGCPALSMATVQNAIDKLKGGSYLYIYDKTHTDVGETVETLKEGSKDDSVKELQRAIGLTDDGIFGPKTKAAVISFQESNGLKGDGIVGELTWAKIHNLPIIITPKPPLNSGIELWYPKANRSISGKMKTRGKYKNEWPKGAIVHWTSGHCESEKDAQNSMSSAIKDQDYAFFVIGPDGIVYQNHPMNEWGYHAGASKWPGLDGTVSDELVGVEVVCAGDVKGAKNTSWFGTNYADERCRKVSTKDNVDAGTYVKYTDAQEKSLTDLILWMHAKNPNIFKIDFVLGHDSVAPGRKVDPGGSLSMTIPEYQKHLKSLI